MSTSGVCETDWLLYKNGIYPKLISQLRLPGGARIIRVIRRSALRNCGSSKRKEDYGDED